MNDGTAGFLLFMLVISWLVWSVAVGYVASQRGRSGVSWALMSIVLSPILGYAVVAAIPALPAGGGWRADA